MGRLRGLFVGGLALVMMLAMVVVITPRASAYGNAVQWQIGFSGNFDVPTSPFGTGGFWGWCVFGGSDGSSAVGTTGTTADCQLTFYFRSGVGVSNNPFHFSFDVTSWLIDTGGRFTPPGVPSFFLTGGTVTATGPGPSIAGIPTGVAIPLSIVCVPNPSPPPGLSPLAGSLCDTGNPASPGHFSFNPVPGVNIEIQVTKVG